MHMFRVLLLAATVSNFYSSCVTVSHTEGKESFDVESPKPPLSNCATHIHKRHPNAESDAAKVMTNNGAVGMPAASVKLMADFLKEGKLNPEHVPTQKGFLKVFTAWVTEDDLLFTTSESPGLQHVFEHLKIRFTLPTHTTVHNQITHIFGEMHDRVKAEMKVCTSSLCYILDHSDLCRAYLAKLHTQLIHGQPVK